MTAIDRVTARAHTHTGAQTHAAVYFAAETDTKSHGDSEREERGKRGVQGGRNRDQGEIEGKEVCTQEMSAEREGESGRKRTCACADAAAVVRVRVRVCVCELLRPHTNALLHDD